MKSYEVAVIAADIPRFCAGVEIWVYPNCNSIVVKAPMANVPLLPKTFVSIRNAAMRGPKTPHTLLMA